METETQTEIYDLSVKEEMLNKIYTTIPEFTLSRVYMDVNNEHVETKLWAVRETEGKSPIAIVSDQYKLDDLQYTISESVRRIGELNAGRILYSEGTAMPIS